MSYRNIRIFKKLPMISRQIATVSASCHQFFIYIVMCGNIYIIYLDMLVLMSKLIIALKNFNNCVLFNIIPH